MAVTGSGDDDFIADRIAVDIPADGFRRQLIVIGIPGANGILDLGALLGGLTETAPGSDTASSGLNGREQRTAQNITTLTGRFPTSVGQKTGALSLATVLASDQILAVTHQVVAPVTAAWTSATANNTALSLAVTGYNTVTVGLNPTTTFTAGALNFEASYDGSVWYAIAGVRTDATTLETSYAITASTVRVWQFNVAGLQVFRVRLSPAITGSGTANVSIQASAGRVSPITVVGGTVATTLAMSSAGSVIGPATVTSSGVSTLLTADSTRKGFQINNESDYPVYLGFVNTINNAGANRFWTLNARTPYTNSLYTGALYAIGPSANGGNNAIIAGGAFS